MPQIQVDYYKVLISSSREIAKQLAIANKLKILELKKGVVGNAPELQELEDEIDG